MSGIRSYCLTGGDSKSCGCLADEWRIALPQSHVTHGMSRSEEHAIWRGIKARCLNPSVAAFRDYGGRGIKVCERWLHSFESFLADMGPRPSGQHSIERVDNDGNYEPANCVWLLRTLQPRNTRLTKRLTLDGVRRSSHDWAALTGIPAEQINKRLGRGWSVKRALTQPLRTRPAP